MTNDIALIIEDDSDMGTIFAAAMHNAGFVAEIASDGQEALDRLAEIVPAVVLLDLHLPTVSGPDILAHMRQDSRLKDVPIIIVTADPHLADTLRSQVSFVLDKPISFKQLSILSNRLRPKSSE